VAQIITFNRMTSKAVLKDVARVLDIPYAEADRMAKMIPVARGKPAKLKVMIGRRYARSLNSSEKYDNDPKVTQKWSIWPCASRAPTKPSAFMPRAW
jgi:DNA polymerase-3 subunit alpha